MRVMLKDVYAWVRYTLVTKSKGRSTFGRQSRRSWQQCQPRQAVEFKLLPICCQNRQQSRPYTATVDSVADLSRRFRQQSTFNKVDRVEFNFVTSVYWALQSTKPWAVMMKDLRCRDVCVMQWVCTQRVRMTLVQCCACVRRCNLTPLDKIWHLQCCSFIETGHLLVMSPNRSNQRQFIYSSYMTVDR